MSVPSELHDQLSQRYVREILGEVKRKGGTREDVLVLMESCLLGGMFVLIKLYGVQPRAAAQYAEEVLTNALERLSDHDKRPVSDG